MLPAGSGGVQNGGRGGLCWAPMAPRARPPFRADHVGSLLRPPRLMQARAEHAEGRLDAKELREIEDDAIREAVALQRDAGLQSATDGEFRRASWHMDFIYQLGGVSQVEGERIHVKFRDEQGEYDFSPPAMRVDGPVRIERTIFGDAFAFLRDTVEGATPKLTIPSPSMVHYRGGNSAIDRTVYPEIEAFWDDLTAAYADEIRRLHELGCTYLQLDDTSLAYVNDPAQREHIASIGGDPEHLHEHYIANINRALAGRPEGLTVTTHMCRGNAQSMWAAEGSYEFVAERLFSDLEVDGFFLEYDDARSGGFEPLRFVPGGKCVVLGLVTTKRPQLEDRDLLKRRIEEASRYVDIDQLCLSPQCGFSSTAEGNRLTIADQVRKLELVVQTAADVWG
jgi:5-methyltetrahydropteroyltriglutamate--homocysteine methyltransferase